MKSKSLSQLAGRLRKRKKWDKNVHQVRQTKVLWFSSNWKQQEAGDWMEFLLEHAVADAGAPSNLR